ncbi:MAG: Flp pilus assembly protein TadD [bacterium]|jgi:Flp pilus assembly protein TadD
MIPNWLKIFCLLSFLLSSCHPAWGGGSKKKEKKAPQGKISATPTNKNTQKSGKQLGDSSTQQGKEKIVGKSSVITEVKEEMDGDTRILRIKIRTEEGKIIETVHRIKGHDFTIRIPYAKPQKQQVVAKSGNGSQQKYQKRTPTTRKKFQNHLASANVAVLNADYGKALKDVNKALDINNNSVKAHMMKGSIYYSRGNTQKAQEEFEIVLQLDPKNPEVKQFQEYLAARNKIIHQKVTPPH